MVIRDLTLRSAASFGSFHLIRLLFDEYMFYLVELRVASALGKSPVSVSMTLDRNVRQDLSTSPTPLLEDEDELIDEEVDDDDEGEEDDDEDDDELNKLLMVVTPPEKVNIKSHFHKCNNNAMFITETRKLR